MFDCDVCVILCRFGISCTGRMKLFPVWCWVWYSLSQPVNLWTHVHSRSSSCFLFCCLARCCEIRQRTRVSLASRMRQEDARHSAKISGAPGECLVIWLYKVTAICWCFNKPFPTSLWNVDQHLKEAKDKWWSAVREGGRSAVLYVIGMFFVLE